MTKDAFFNVPMETVKTSQGDVQLPILYYDLSFMMAFFWVEPDDVSPILSGAGLKPVTILNGKTIAGLAFYEYRNTGVGSYNEVGLAIAALPWEKFSPWFPALELLMPLKMRRMGFHVIDLPVTTKEADAAGREIWGYPKFVTEIPLTFRSDYFSGKVMDPQDPKMPIFSLDGKIGKGLQLPAFQMNTYTVLNDKRIKTFIDVRGSFQYFLNTNFKLQVGTSSHHMAQNLKLLKLDQKCPFLLGVSHNWQSRLNKGTLIE